MEIKPCPFCGSIDIKPSLKVSSAGCAEVRYHATMYCNKCHCYGPRVITKVVRYDDYSGRTELEKDQEIKEKAIDAWNKREVPDVPDLMEAYLEIERELVSSTIRTSTITSDDIVIKCYDSLQKIYNFIQKINNNIDFNNNL